MSAIYGIIGNVAYEQLESMGEKLIHRGRQKFEWSPAPSVFFGKRFFGNREQAYDETDVPLIACASIYNMKAIIDVVKSFAFLSNQNSAEEILYLAYKAHGPEFFKFINGDFVISLWDIEKKKLVLGRDILGSRSLYYRRGPGLFAFASEYKALIDLDEFETQPDLESIQYLQDSKYLLPGRTLLAGVQSIRSGHYLAVSDSQFIGNKYWDFTMSPSKTDSYTAQETIKSLFLQSVERRLVDVNCLQAELSGGIDSSAVVAALRHFCPNDPIKTFTIGDDEDDPEIIMARRIADRFNTDHNEFLVDPEDLIDDLPSYVWHLEDPIGRTEGYLYYKLLGALSNQGSVIFGGTMSDGLFAGMPRHKLVKLMQVFPIARVPLEEFYHYTQVSSEPRTFTGKILKNLYFRNGDVKTPGIDGADNTKPKSLPGIKGDMLNLVLRDGLLNGAPNSMAKVEKTHMAYGVEFRTPFTDNDFIEYSFKLPETMKMHRFQEKYILRKALLTLLPKEVAERPKFPQMMAYDSKLSKVLENLGDIYLRPENVKARGFFAQEDIKNLRKRENEKPYSSIQAMRLWTAVLTEIWAQIYLDKRQKPNYLST